MSQRGLAQDRVNAALASLDHRDNRILKQTQAE
jgi:hypothetical protein